ncbi:MAG: dihydrolipoyl dehydrogenase [Candidatus Amulumruptor caecigallinarius]|nr:dihydrolipoyl dehydrogenase [Candidatus Amulumruptor caecigallinarius]MCM1396454.1 dihydrolipoyl dehydrogenase [Candidatus Amulumruptor caecigallinarius]MCM1453489.1 dihydrolipoyl dehydrogenase [bacterium]
MAIHHSDLIITGAGPGGLDTAVEASRMGLNVTLIERDSVGGTCLNRGCIPTKTLAASADAALAAAEAADFGIELPSWSVDYPRIHARMEEVLARLREGAESTLGRVTLVRGTARIAATGPSVWVGQEQYTADRLIIATGSEPATLPIPGADLALTSDGMLALTSLPASLVIIGGGVIGMEFASIFAALGTQVTVLEACREILPGFDAEVAKRLRSLLTRRGIKVVTDARVSAIETSGVSLRVNYTAKGREQSVEAGKVMMAVGRRPVFPEGLDVAEIKYDRRGIITDENFMTSRDRIYAIGDVNGRCQLAHAATAQGRQVLGLAVNSRCIPSVVFTVPEVAMAGLTEQQCTERGLFFKVDKALFASNGKAVASGHADGFVKVIADAVGGAILGIHIIGPHAGDLIQEGVTAIDNALTAGELTQDIHAHPTLSETLREACAALSR